MDQLEALWMAKMEEPELTTIILVFGILGVIAVIIKLMTMGNKKPVLEESGQLGTAKFIPNTSEKSDGGYRIIIGFEHDGLADRGGVSISEKKVSDQEIKFYRGGMLAARYPALQASIDEEVVSNSEDDATQSGCNPVFYSGDAHLLTVGHTRSGKGVGAIIPNLLTYPGSMIVIDPKGENAIATAHYRRSVGHRVIVLDPWKVTDIPSASYNPLSIAGDMEERLIEDASLIADALVVPVEGQNQFFWEEEARSLIATIVLYLSHEKNGSNNLAKLREIVAQGGKGLEDFLVGISMSPLHNGALARGASQFLQKAPNEKSGVLSTVRQQTAFLDSPSIQQVLSTSSFSFSSLRDVKTTVYIVIPIWRLATYGRWLRLIVTMALTELSRAKGKPTVRTLMILDEFPALGMLKSFDTAMGIMAGLGVQLWPIVQDFTQLQKMYGDSWQTFVANADVLQSFGTRDILTASYISERLGTSTVPVYEKSSSVGHQHDVNTVSGRYTARPLMYPDEIIRLEKSAGIAFIENNFPLIFRKIRYYEDEYFSSIISTVLRG
ncbi:type IV secretory system conjugative DNA transfer family protein (plasmid) [Azospirillum sp. A29]|uniref:type IV secretory system conjugative DNA transfer family protein n=1 Tax=Azospirillum sp. A29 TaxID=3160606 RepID=UPI00366FDE89